MYNYIAFLLISVWISFGYISDSLFLFSNRARILNYLEENSIDINDENNISLQRWESINSQEETNRIFPVSKGTALLMLRAIKDGRLDVVKYLFIYKIEVKFGASSVNESLSLVDESPAESSPVNEFFSSAIFFVYAASYNRLDIVKYFASYDGFHIYIPQAFTEACINGNLDVIEYFVEQKIDVNLQEGYPLLSSVSRGNLSIVKYLLDNGAKTFNDKYDNEMSMLLGSSRKGYTDIVEILIKNGANIERCNGAALILAAAKGHLSTVKLLISHKADINTQNGLAINLAVYNENYEVVKYLFENGAKITECTLVMILENFPNSYQNEDEKFIGNEIGHIMKGEKISSSMKKNCFIELGFIQDHKKAMYKLLTCRNSHGHKR